MTRNNSPNYLSHRVPIIYIRPALNEVLLILSPTKTLY